MPRPLTRSALAAACLAVIGALTPTAASAQFTTTACLSTNVCSWGQASVTGSLLTLRLQNLDASFGTSLFSASIGFANALSNNQQVVATVGRSPSGTSLFGNAVLGNGGGFVFDSFLSSSSIELSNFNNLFIEGPAATGYRTDPAAGAYVTSGAVGDSYFEFTADISSFGDLSRNDITSLDLSIDDSNPALTVTPEPASLALLATGLFPLGAAMRRRRRSARA